VDVEGVILEAGRSMRADHSGIFALSNGVQLNMLLTLFFEHKQLVQTLRDETAQLVDVHASVSLFVCCFVD
jgi:hypothetical protein